LALGARESNISKKKTIESGHAVLASDDLKSFHDKHYDNYKWIKDYLHDDPNISFSDYFNKYKKNDNDDLEIIKNQLKENIDLLFNEYRNDFFSMCNDIDQKIDVFNTFDAFLYKMSGHFFQDLFYKATEEFDNDKDNIEKFKEDMKVYQTCVLNLRNDLHKSLSALSEQKFYIKFFNNYFKRITPLENDSATKDEYHERMMVFLKDIFFQRLTQSKKLNFHDKHYDNYKWIKDYLHDDPPISFSDYFNKHKKNDNDDLEIIKNQLKENIKLLFNKYRNDFFFRCNKINQQTDVFKTFDDFLKMMSAHFFKYLYDKTGKEFDNNEKYNEDIKEFQTCKLNLIKNLNEDLENMLKQKLYINVFNNYFKKITPLENDSATKDKYHKIMMDFLKDFFFNSLTKSPKLTIHENSN